MIRDTTGGPAGGTVLLKCPSCGLPPNDVRGDPFEHSEIMPLSEMTIFIHCDNGHAWFEARRWDRDGNVEQAWAEEASNASGGAAAPQSQVAGSSGEKERP